MFSKLSLKATSIILLLLLLLATGVSVIGGSYINNDARYIQTSWQTFDAERSEMTRFESQLRAALGYGGMIHDFKNYVLRKDPKLKILALGHLNKGRAVIDQYRNLNLSNAERAAIQDIDSTINDYEKSLNQAASMIKNGANSVSIDHKVKVDDVPALHALAMLHKQSSIRVMRYGTPASKALLLSELRGVLGFGGMIHSFKNYILRKDSADYQASISKIREGQALLKTYRELLPTPGEEAALYDIENILTAYADALKSKQNQIISDSSPEDIDQTVQVDDSKALRALSILDSEIEATIQVRSLTMDTTINQLVDISTSLLWGGMIILGSVALFSFMLIRSQFIAPLQLLSSSMKALCSGNFEIAIANTNSVNEIGDMARAVQLFRENLIHVKEVEERLTQSNEELNAQLSSVQDLKTRSDEQAVKAINLAEGLAAARNEAQQSSQRAEADENRIRTIMNTVIDGIITIDAKGLIETFNLAAQSMFGYTDEEVMGKNVNILMPEPYKSKHDQFLASYHLGEGAGLMGKRVELTAIRLDGTTFPIELTIRMTRIGGDAKFIGVMRDITEQKAAKEEIHRLAMTDQLTGLANRNLFHQRFDESLKL
ncbi:MAG: PAS domain S-box protein, partial [Gallionellaceae bacterium]